ncbi:RNA polymerase sigma factor [Olivibacter sitiensis]|uniref:RNA polymerase sigma factor n=1 Tax=Olivibacter sitiensis TaxID=376470 RepID=UPI00056B2281|nr:RNA polymerase sigma-70 factor [Olivibacter sitiensis]
MTENILLQKLSEGDESAFSMVFDLHWESLFTYVVRVLKDKDESVDIVQDTFAALWQQRDRLSHVKSLKGYLFSIAHYKALRYIKCNIQRNDYIKSMSAFLPDHESNLEANLYARELTLYIEKELLNLPPKMREVFMLSRMEHLSHKEIAGKLGISENTVKKQINYSIRFLRLKIDNQYLSSVLLLCELFGR